MKEIYLFIKSLQVHRYIQGNGSQKNSTAKHDSCHSAGFTEYYIIFTYLGHLNTKSIIFLLTLRLSTQSTINSNTF